MISSDYSYLVPQWIRDETNPIGNFLTNSNIAIRNSLYNISKCYGKGDYLLIKSKTRIQWSKHYRETVKNYTK